MGKPPFPMGFPIVSSHVVLLDLRHQTQRTIDPSPVAQVVPARSSRVRHRAGPGPQRIHRKKWIETDLQTKNIRKAS